MKKAILYGTFALSCFLWAYTQNSEKKATVSENSTYYYTQFGLDRYLPTLHPMADFPEMTTGKITYYSGFKPNAWLDQPIPYADLGEIMSPSSKIQMISFGGGTTAGVSNGGLNREGQQFAYPNLVAHQMGLTNFVTPLFDENEANGTGIFLYADPTAKYPRWKEVSNDLANVQKGETVRFTPYAGKVDNYAFPNGGTLNLDFAHPYLFRFMPRAQSPTAKAIDYIRERQNYDLAIMEDFFDYWILSVLNEERLDYRHLNGAIMHTGDVPLYGMKAVLNNGQKGVVFTIPNYLDLACMNWYSVEKLKKITPSFTILYSDNGEKKSLDQSSTFQFKPTVRVDSLFQNIRQGQAVTVRLSDNDLIDKQEMWVANPDLMYNPKIRDFAKANNLALVDLRALYEKIHQGIYTTDDGYKIDGSMKGNFYSSDGIYPTPIGQAVIANEVIKAINSKYKARIPLINIGEYANSIGIK